MQFLERPAARLLGDDRQADLTGARIGPYVVETRIDGGGMGEVYRAQDTRLGRAVAIKVLPPHGTVTCFRTGEHANQPGVTFSKTNPTATTLMLSAAIPFSAANVISSVQSELFYCADTVAPRDCGAATTFLGGGTFSGTTLPSSVQVGVGQIVQLSVTFSFS